MPALCGFSASIKYCAPIHNHDLGLHLCVLPLTSLKKHELLPFFFSINALFSYFLLLQYLFIVCVCVWAWVWHAGMLAYFIGLTLPGDHTGCENVSTTPCHVQKTISQVSSPASDSYVLSVPEIPTPWWGVEMSHLGYEQPVTSTF